LFVMLGFMFFYKIFALLDADARKLDPERLSIYTAAAQQIIMILMIFFTAFIAYGTATATLVGQSMGAKRTDLAEQYGWEAVKIGVYGTTAIGLLVAGFSQQVLHVFTHDPAVIDVAIPVLRVCGLMLPLVLSGLVLTQALFGA